MNRSVGVLREVLVATSRWREAAAERNIPKVEIDPMAPAFEHTETETAPGAHGWVGQRAERPHLDTGSTPPRR
jgi:hypothetical protein